MDVIYKTKRFRNDVLQRKIAVQMNINLDKGKAVPLQAWSGPEGSRKLRFPDFMTTV